MKKDQNTGAGFEGQVIFGVVRICTKTMSGENTNRCILQMVYRMKGNLYKRTSNPIYHSSSSLGFKPSTSFWLSSRNQGLPSLPPGRASLLDSYQLIYACGPPEQLHLMSYRHPNSTHPKQKSSLDLPTWKNFVAENSNTSHKIDKETHESSFASHFSQTSHSTHNHCQFEL